MSEVSFHTLQLQDWLARMAADDQAARNELAQEIGRRVERLARKMIRGFDNVRRDADTLDVAQGALLRILPALEEPGRHFDSTRELMAFAAACIRSELLDLARRAGTAKRAGGKVVSVAGESSQNVAVEAAAPHMDQEELDHWTRFHEAVEKLPAEEREVVGLKFYHGWGEKEIGELLQVSDRTVRRRWASACVRLEKAMGGEMPS
jgi:RNA polymerase sigma factor (sigma-70 family)